MYRPSPNLQSRGLPLRQRGVITIVTALILLVLLTVATLYSTKSGLEEQRIAGNQFRYGESFQAAEAGLDYAYAALRRNRRWGEGTANYDSDGDNTDDAYVYASTSTDLAGGAQFQIRKITPIYRDTDLDGTTEEYDSVEIRSRGISVDQTGETIVSTIIGGIPSLGGGPRVPLMASGSVSAALSMGGANIVTAPNSGGVGVYLSAWSKNNVDFESSGSAATCHVESMLANEDSEAAFRAVEATAAADGTHTYAGISNKYPVYWDDDGQFLVGCASCQCRTSDAISQSGIEQEDILDNDTTNFPPDVFEYIFGVSNHDYQTIKDDAQVISDCGTLDAQSSGLYWIDGDCSIPANTVVGSFAKPVMIVVGGDLTMNSNSRVFGFLFSWTPWTTSQTTDGAAIGDREVQLNGGPVIYGGLICNYDVDHFNGNYTIFFTERLARNLAENPDAQLLGELPGSWTDINTQL